MERAQASELQRLCETTMITGTLKFSDLLKNVAHVSRITTPPSLTLNAALTPPIPDSSRKPQAEAYRGSSNKEMRTCFYCQKKGHISKDCYKKNRDNKRNTGPRSYSSRDNEENDAPTGRQLTPQQ